MAGSIIVRYAKKSYKQRQKEGTGTHAQMSKQLNYSVDIVPDSESIMTFEDWDSAREFAKRQREEGYHVISMKDDYRRS